MKALVCESYGPIDDLQVKDIAPPVPGPGQLLIKVTAAAVNFPDALIVQGMYQIKPRLPFTPGGEMAGTVVAVGPGVTQRQVGDRVIAYTGTGGFAELCLADAAGSVALPEGRSFETGAALVLTYCTSLHGLKDCGHLQAGETLVVLGAAGGVGVAAIEIGKAMGARVIAAASSEEKLALCRKLGADATINYQSENLKERILALTDGRGADVVYDPVGGAYTEQAVRALAWRGRLLVVGFAAGDIPKIALNLALLKERSLVGVYWGDAIRHHPQQHQDNLRQLTEWLQAGVIDPVISQRYPLDKAKDAIKLMAGRGAQGKIVVLLGDGA